MGCTCCAPENLRDLACAGLDFLRVTQEGALHDYSQDPLPLRYEWDGRGNGICIENNYPPAECCSSSAPEECSTYTIPITAVVDAGTDDYTKLGTTDYEWHSGSCFQTSYQCCPFQSLQCEACRLGVDLAVLRTCCAPEDLRDLA